LANQSWQLKATVNQADNDENTPLWIAAQKGRTNIVVLLVEQGKASVEQANDIAMTPSHIAAKNGH
jgi:ankyrin repeat protein